MPLQTRISSQEDEESDFYFNSEAHIIPDLSEMTLTRRSKKISFKINREVEERRSSIGQNIEIIQVKDSIKRFFKNTIFFLSFGITECTESRGQNPCRDVNCR